MSYKGIYDRTIFYNPDTRFSIISVKTNDTSVPAHVRNSYKYRDHLIRFTASGFALPQSDCVELELAGEWVNNEKYGYHLQVEQCREIVPRTVAGIKGYLSSGLLKGIGKATAEEIVSRFGVAALDILEHEPERFLEVRGITPERLTEIKESYTPDMPVEEICARMTLEEAQNYIVDTGTCKGWPLSQVAERRPASLRFYVNGYQGDNNILRAGAKLLLNNMEAMNIAS